MLNPLLHSSFRRRAAVNRRKNAGGDGEKRRRRSAQSGASRSQEESIAENITPVWVNVRVEVGRGLRKYVER